MYERFYGLRAKPFCIAPQAEFLYPSRRHRRALDLLHYGVATHAPFIVVSGEIGTGKTTLLRHLLGRLGADTLVASVAQAHGGYASLLRRVADAFGLRAEGDEFGVEKRVLARVAQEHRRGRPVVLVVDEAQGLTAGALEKLRLLSNVNAGGEAPLQVILAGQRGLRERLREPGLAQLAQRVVVDYHLGPLEQDETAPYVRHRLRVAGAERELFDEEACALVHAHSGGVPRLVNLLCDFALVYGYAAQAPAIGRELVEEVARDRAGAIARAEPGAAAA
jgi:type II secretory pathway predicted ATPase ExeA